MKLETTNNGILLKLESYKEKILLTYVSELDSSKKISIIITPRLYKKNPSFLLHIDESELELFGRDEDFYLIAQDLGIDDEWLRITKENEFKNREELREEEREIVGVLFND